MKHECRSATDRFASNAGTGTAVFSDAHVDSADDYSADGVLESQGCSSLYLLVSGRSPKYPMNGWSAPAR